jgi:hypothetical protein
MQGVRFYLEPGGVNVFAAWPDNVTAMGNVEGIGSVFDYADSPVASTAASRSFLNRCHRISEAEARQVHPTLFERLD